MENNMVSLKIDETMVSRVLEKQIQAAIVAQLGNQDKLIEKAVSVALAQKVNSDGKVDNYNSYNTHDFLEVLASKSVRAAATEALKEWLNENQVKIKNALLKELSTPNRQRSIATAYADAIEESLKCNWNMTCNIQFKEREK
jgi:formaldehyde-activating enzyme involved in methanogenesis